MAFEDLGPGRMSIGRPQTIITGPRDNVHELIEVVQEQVKVIQSQQKTIDKLIDLLVKPKQKAPVITKVSSAIK